MADDRDIVVEVDRIHLRELAGAEPAYFEAHAVMSDNLMRAITYVAEQEGLKEQPMSFDPTARVTCGSTELRMVMRSMSPDYEPAASIRAAVEDMADGETVVFVCHPGYLDRFILENSSLTTDRTKEVDALIDPDLRAWLEGRADLRLVDYRDL